MSYSLSYFRISSNLRQVGGGYWPAKLNFLQCSIPCYFFKYFFSGIEMMGNKGSQRQDSNCIQQWFFSSKHLYL